MPVSHKLQIINEHATSGPGDGRIRTILSWSENDAGDVQLYRLGREIRYSGADEWRPLVTDDGVKLRNAEILRIAAVVCQHHAEFIERKADARRTSLAVKRSPTALDEHGRLLVVGDRVTSLEGSPLHVGEVLSVRGGFILVQHNEGCCAITVSTSMANLWTWLEPGR